MNLSTNLKNIAKPVEAFVAQNSPSILTGVGIVGMLTSIIFAAKSTPKYIELKEAAKAKYDETTKTTTRMVEEGKALAKSYWPSAVSFGASTACLIGANSINLRRNAALVAAYKLSESYLKDYKATVAEKLTGKKKEEFDKSVTAKQLTSAGYDPEQDMRPHAAGDLLYFDPKSGQTFWSTATKLDAAVNYVNKRLMSGDTVYLNDFYDEVGLIRTDVGEIMGWQYENDGCLFEYHLEGVDPMVIGRPAFAIIYDCTPVDYH